MNELNIDQLKVSVIKPSGSRVEPRSDSDIKTGRPYPVPRDITVVLNAVNISSSKQYWLLKYFGIIYFFTVVVLKTIEYVLFCTYYAYQSLFVWLLCGYSIITAMAIWSFCVVFFTPKTPVPDKFKLTPEEHSLLEPYLPSVLHPTASKHLRTMAKHRAVRTVNRSHCVNLCELCNQIKPDRAHHCQRCQRCVLRMDHHCPFFNRCIEYHIHKAFLLTIFYSAIGCLYTFISQLILRSNNPVDVNTYLSIFMIASLFCDICGALCFTTFFVYQFSKACKNETSFNFLYVFTDIPSDSYNLGSIMENLTETLGSFHLWLIPTLAPGDGVTWRTLKTKSPNAPKDTDFV